MPTPRRRRWFQFTIANLLRATFWFAATFAIFAISARITIVQPEKPVEWPGLPGVFALTCVELVTLGTAIGAIFGRSARGAIVAAVLFVPFVLIFWKMVS